MILTKTPEFINKCPLIEGWCKYSGEIYYASLNYNAPIP
jgi:hypothetical protein